MAGNRRRNRKKKKQGANYLATWGSLLSPRDDEQEKEDLSPNVSFYMPEDEEEEEEQRPSLLGRIWQRFNFWASLAVALFLLFVWVLGLMVVRMWTPQTLDDIAGFSDKGSGKDIAALLRHSQGEEIVFTEAEINRFLRETCRLRQTGLFSIIAHAHRVAVRIHDGYAEVIIDRLIGANIHQTTAVHVTFSQDSQHGSPVLLAELRGGPPILGSMPRGGRIGTMAVPSRHMQMLQPALQTLLACYPDITQAVEDHGYLPRFVKGGEGEESYVRLIPHRPEE